MNKVHIQELNKFAFFLSEIRCLKETTISTHTNHMRSLITFLGNKPFNAVTVSDIYNFVFYLKNKDRTFHSRYSIYGPGKMHLRTVKTYITSIRQFFQWYKAMGNTCLDYLSIASPKVQASKIESLSLEEIDILIKAPVEVRSRQDMQYRDTLLFMVGYMMGLRISEALNLTFDELLTKDGFVDIIGKGAKSRRLPIPTIIKDTVNDFRKIRGGSRIYRDNVAHSNGTIFRRKVESYEANPSLVFINMTQSSYGTKFARGGLNRMLRKYEKLISPTKRVTYHLLRHSFGTQLLKRGVSIKVVQEMLGHSTILATQHYLDVDGESMKNAQACLLNSNTQSDLFTINTKSILKGLPPQGQHLTHAIS